MNISIVVADCVREKENNFACFLNDDNVQFKSDHYVILIRYLFFFVHFIFKNVIFLVLKSVDVSFRPSWTIPLAIGSSLVLFLLIIGTIVLALIPIYLKTRDITLKQSLFSFYDESMT